MIGKILRDKPSTIAGYYFFRKGDIVSCGYHDEDGEPQEEESERLWVETFDWNPSASLDFLNADDVQVISHLSWQEYLEQEGDKNVRH